MKRLIIPGLIITLSLSSCGIKNREPVSRSDFLLNTIVKITLYEEEESSKILLDDMFTEINNCENRYSRHIPESETAGINNNPGMPVPVSKDTFELIEQSIRFSKLSDGLFDISIGSLVDLWNINSDNPHVPTQEEIDAVLKNIDYRKIIMDKEDSTITIPEGGMSIDTGAIAKGYITDILVKYLREKDIASAIIDLGGNLYLFGSKPDGSEWNVGIRNPFGFQGDYLGTVLVKDISVVTSGIYERFFEADGERYHHILNPGTGYPENNSLASVSVLSKSSTEADGLTTATFLLGLEKGMLLVESLDGVEAIMVTKDKKIYLSSGIKSGKIPFRLANDEFTVAE